ALPKSEINPFETCSENKTYIIKQLTTSRQLYLEGYDLKHCVYTYVSRCMWRDCQIFSLRMLDREEETPLLTIELDGASIVQIRGKHNRSATLSELELVKSWAKKEKLYLYEAA
ncbi:MAG: PcfJ domain-containing protein, partial [Bacteroidota bacterium]